MGIAAKLWPALNPLSIHVTLTAIVPGAYPGEAKCAKNVLKWRTFELTGWITGKWLRIDGHMLRCVWQASNPLFSFHPCKIYREYTRGGQYVQKLTHVPLSIAILVNLIFVIEMKWEILKRKHDHRFQRSKTPSLMAAMILLLVFRSQIVLWPSYPQELLLGKTVPL